MRPTRILAVMILWIAAMVASPIHAQETLSSGGVTMTFDPVREVWVIRYRGAAGPVEAIYDQSNKVRPVMTPVVTFAPSTGLFRYRYTVANSRAAKQAIFDVSIDAKTPIVNEQSVTAPITGHEDPAGWVFMTPVTDDSPSYTWGARPSRHIVPGTRVTGFALSSRALPGILLGEFVGYRSLASLVFPDEPPPDVGKLVQQINTRPGAREVRVKTVAPDILPDGKTPVQLVDRLIALKHQAVALGWIGRLKPEEREKDDDRDNRKRKNAREREREDREDEERGKGVVRSLDVKLEAAARHILQGKLKTAGNILHAFIHELEAQRGKHLNDNAFFLLKPNAEFIIARLPRQEKEDEDRDDRPRQKRR